MSNIIAKSSLRAKKNVQKLNVYSRKTEIFLIPFIGICAKIYAQIVQSDYFR